MGSSKNSRTNMAGLILDDGPGGYSIIVVKGKFYNTFFRRKLRFMFICNMHLVLEMLNWYEPRYCPVQILMNLLYSIIFKPDSTLCGKNFFENKCTPSAHLIEENTISSIRLHIDSNCLSTY